MTIAQIPLPDLMRRTAKRTALVGEEIIVDLFAGGGGASRGIEEGLGRDVDEAINHDAEAIEMHRRNHPRTRHYTADVWEKDPHDVAAGRPVGLLWLSPDCKDHSRAKGGVPIRNKRIRALAWVGVKWARMDGRAIGGKAPTRRLRPRVIMLENVPEFVEWCPLIAVRDAQGRIIFDPKTGKPLMERDKSRKGETFKRFVVQLRRLGYVVEWRILDAAAYGTPTHRKRIYLIARCDGEAIVWPEPTHGPVESAYDTRALRQRRPSRISDVSMPEMSGAFPRHTRDLPRANALPDVSTGRGRRAASAAKAVEKTTLERALKPYRTAAECIDWSLPCPSIFLTRQQAGELGFRVQRPLAPKTLRRIVMGLIRYVFKAEDPFIVRVNHGGEEWRGQSINEPLRTVTQKHGYGVVSPIVAQLAFGEGLHGRWGIGSRPVTEPLGVVHAGGKNFALTAAHLSKFYGGVVGQPVTLPAPTITAIDHTALVTATVTKFRGDSAGHPLTVPLATITSGDGAARPAGAAHALGITAATLAPLMVDCANSTWSKGHRPANIPMATITAKPDGGSWALATATLTPLFGDPRSPIATMDTSNRFAIVAPVVSKFYGTSATGCPITIPMPTITSGAGGGHMGLATPFFCKYYGCGVGQRATEPLHTITTVDRFNLAVPVITPAGIVGPIGRAHEVYAFLVTYRDQLAGVPNVTLHDDLRIVTVRLRGEDYLMTDIGLRMLQPRELAAAQFTPEIAADYILPTKGSTAVAKIGNSVCPPVPAALTRANCQYLIVREGRRRKAG